jgi:hypothetical protein
VTPRRLFPFLLALALVPSAWSGAPDVAIHAAPDAIEVLLPLTAVTGKVRVKQRAADGFGIPIAPRQTRLDSRCYLEWQIGYDTPDPHSSTVAPGIVFQRRDETKYGHELSAILLDARQAGLLSDKELRATRDFLAKHRDGPFFEDSEKITLEQTARSAESLPSGFEGRVEKVPIYLKHTPAGSIELALRHKQRAVGYQAMLYVCLPVDKLSRPDGSPRADGPAQPREIAIYRFTRARMGFLMDIARAFGMASRQHNEDLTKIIVLVLAQPLTPRAPAPPSSGARAATPSP